MFAQTKQQANPHAQHDKEGNITNGFNNACIFIGCLFSAVPFSMLEGNTSTRIPVTTENCITSHMETLQLISFQCPTVGLTEYYGRARRCYIVLLFPGPMMTGTDKIKTPKARQRLDLLPVACLLCAVLRLCAGLLFEGSPTIGWVGAGIYIYINV